MSEELHAKILGFLTVELVRTEGRQCTRIDLLYTPGDGFRDEMLGQWYREDDPELFNGSSFRVEQLVSTMIEIAEDSAGAGGREIGSHRYVVRTFQHLGGRARLSFRIATAATTFHGSDTIEELVALVIEYASAEAGKAEAAGEIAQHDAWQIALDAARELRERVAAARAASSEEPTDVMTEAAR